MQSTTDFFRGARTFDGALDQLADAVGALGFDAVDYGFIPRARAHDGRYHSPTIFSRNFPLRWMRGWTPYLVEDPLLHACYPRTLPLDWKEIEDAAWLNPLQREAFGFIRDMGFGDGVSVPIHLPHDGFAFVTAASRQRFGAWRERQAESIDRLFLLSHRFHAAYGASAPAASPPMPSGKLLSAREQAVLTFAASGLTAPESARRTGHSAETVRRQRKSAMHKLGAQTIAQAVMRATHLGLI